MSVCATAIDPAVRTLIHGIVKRYWRPGINRDDLVEAGMAAAALATQRFDPRRGSKLTTFLRPRVRGAIVNAVNESRMIHVPSRLQGTLDPNQTGECIDAARRVRTARFVGNSNDEDGDILDLLADERTLPDKWIVAEMVDDLPDVEAEVVRHLVGLDDTPPMTVDALAALLDLPAIEVTEIRDRAYATLRRRYDDLDYPQSPFNEEPTMSRLNGFHAPEPPVATITAESRDNKTCPSCNRRFKNPKVARCYYRDCSASGYGTTTTKGKNAGRAEKPKAPAGAIDPSATAGAVSVPASPQSFADELQIMSLMTGLLPAARKRVLAWISSAFGA